MTGQTISHYRVLEPLGRGGMGVVFKAVDVRLQRFVALKFLPDGVAADPMAFARFEREARAASRLNHPNICTIYDVGQHEGRPFIAMEFLEGQTLRQRLDREPLAPSDVARVGVEIADALATAHAAGIVHRDITPANVFITIADRVKVLDFGLAKMTPPGDAGGVSEMATEAATLTGDGIALGTLAYMSPEQARGEELDARTDVFSLGAVLYEMATGRRAFVGKTAAVVHDAILNRPVVPAAGVHDSVPARLDDIISKALEKDRARRYQSASELAADLRQLAADLANGVAAAPRSARDDLSLAPAASSWRGRWQWSAALSAAIVTAIGAASWMLADQRRYALTDKDTVLVADFENKTSDPVFEETLRQGLSVQLEQSPFLSIVPDPEIQQTLQLMGQKPDAKLTGRIAREACQRAGNSVVLQGSIAQVGSEYELIVRAMHCSTGASVASAEARAADKNHVLDALTAAAGAIRTRLGESRRTLQKFDTPLERATTSSLPALQAFSAAFKALYGPGGSAAALPFFRRATELDPAFAMAYAMLGRVLTDVGELTGAMDATNKAYELRDRASEPERYFITASHRLLVTGDLAKAEETCLLWIQAYPRAVEPRNLIAGPVYLQLGEYEKTIQHANEAIRAHPTLPIAYAHAVFADIALNRIDAARAAYDAAVAHHVDSSFTDAALYTIDFLTGDAAARAELVTDVRRKPNMENVMRANEALSASYSGQLRKARDLMLQAAESAARGGREEERAGYLVAAALTDGVTGHGEEAEREAADALALSTARDNEYAAALALAMSGRPGRAPAIAEDLAARFPDDTVAQLNYLPVLRAQLALARHDPAGAIEALRPALPYELGQPGQTFVIFLTGYPMYVRGLAYLAAGRGQEAAAEFKKIVDYPGIVINEPIGALAQLGMARGLALQHQHEAARSAYETFLRAWKDADSDVPVLQLAKAEYAALPK